jgi:uncharacterized protein (TIGR02271 family)
MATETLNKSAVVGVFQHRHDAQACVNELKRSGFRDDEIGMISRDHRTGADADDVGDTKVGEGAAIGAATGAGVGALWAIGIAAGFLPAIGPAIAGGIFASILASAAGAAAVGGIVGALIGLGIPEEEARFYEAEFKAGRTIVTVNAGERIGLAREILRRHNGFDRMEREATTTTAGRGAIPTNRFTNPPKMPESRTLRDTEACAVQQSQTGEANVQLKKEELHARKENETVGEVRIHKDVVTEHKTMDVPVTREEVVIERTPVSGGPATAIELRPGEEVRVPVKEEHVRLEKTAHVAEQVKVSKRKVQETKHVAGDVRHEELRVEKEGSPRVEGCDMPSKHPK